MFLFRGFTVDQIWIANIDESTFDRIFASKNYDPFQLNLPFPLWIFAFMFKQENSYYVVSGEVWDTDNVELINNLDLPKVGSPSGDN